MVYLPASIPLVIEVNAFIEKYAARGTAFAVLPVGGGLLVHSKAECALLLLFTLLTLILPVFG